MSTHPSAPVAGKRHLSVLLMLAWPAILEQLLLTLVRYVDTAMVGALGANATAAVSISNSPNMLVNGTIMAIGVGFTAMISRAIGAEDLQRAKDLMRQALLVVVALSVRLIAQSVPQVWSQQIDVMYYLESAMTLAIGIEFVKMLCTHTSETVIEILLFAISRQ